MNPYDGHYYARSRALLKSQRGWIKPLLVLAAAQFVPVVGALGVTGYLLEYARLVAWGVDAAPKQKNVQVGACIRAGWRGFVAGLGAALAATLIEMGLGYLFGADSEVVSFVASVLSLLAGTVSVVCALHATVYQNFRAGYKRRIGQMLSGDFAGIVRISLVYLLGHARGDDRGRGLSVHAAVPRRLQRLRARHRDPDFPGRARCHVCAAHPGPVGRPVVPPLQRTRVGLDGCAAAAAGPTGQSAAPAVGWLRLTVSAVGLHAVGASVYPVCLPCLSLFLFVCLCKETREGLRKKTT